MFHAARLLLTLALVGCGSEPPAFELDPLERSARARTEDACLGGREVASGPIEDVFTPPSGWVRVEAELGRCDGPGMGLDFTVDVERGERTWHAATIRFSEPDTTHRQTVAFLTYVHPDSRIRLRVDPAEGGETSTFLDHVRWTFFGARPEAVPDGATHVLAADLSLRGDRLEARPPAQVRLRAEAGVHTLSGAWGPRGIPEQPAQLTVASVGQGRRPFATWNAESAGVTPFTVTWTGQAREPVDVWTVAEPDEVLVFEGLRHDAQPSLARPPPPPVPERAPTPAPREPERVTFLGAVRASGPASERFCDERSAYLVPAPSQLTIPAGLPRTLRGGVGPCEPDAAGEATWRIVDARGRERWSSALSWEPGEPVVGRFEVPIAEGAETRLVSEGSPLTAWLELRAPFVLDGSSASASGFNESEHNHLYRPENVLDGDLETEWHAPDEARSNAWLEVQLGQAVTMRRVAVTNGRNPGYDDRGTGRVRVLALAGETEVAEVTVELAPATDPPVAVTIPLSARDVDRLRLEPQTWRGLGPAIAEIEVE